MVVINIYENIICETWLKWEQSVPFCINFGSAWMGIIPSLFSYAPSKFLCNTRCKLGRFYYLKDELCDCKNELQRKTGEVFFKDMVSKDTLLQVSTK